MLAFLWKMSGCADTSQGRASEEEEEEEDPLELLFRDSLLPAIERNKIAEVRAVLNSVAGVDNSSEEQEHAAKSNSVCLARQPRSAEEQSPDRIRRLVNFVRRPCGRNMLYFALERGQFDIARELLNHGVDPSWEFQSEMPMVRFLAGTKGEVNRHKASCLDQVVRHGDVPMMQLLMAASAQVTARTWNVWLEKRNRWDPHGSLAVLKALSESGTPIPIYVACCAMRGNYDSEEDLDVLTGMLRSIEISWVHGGYQKELEGIRDMINDPRSYFLLRRPAIGLEQQYFKSLLMQSVLLHVFCRRGRIPKSFVRILLEEGASIHGWTYAHAMAMQRALTCLRLPSRVLKEGKMAMESETAVADVRIRGHREFRHLFLGYASIVCQPCQSSVIKACSYDMEGSDRGSDQDCAAVAAAACVDDSKQKQIRTPGLASLTRLCRHQLSDPFLYPLLFPPCFLPAVLCHVRSEDNDLKEILLTQTRVAWLADPQRIPSAGHSHVYGILELHDGPTSADHVGLSAEQKKVSLAMCMCSGGTVQSLTSLCRDVITTACLEHTNDIFFAIDNLPLSALLKSYLVSN